jgi:hypothetical protein
MPGIEEVFDELNAPADLLKELDEELDGLDLASAAAVGVVKIVEEPDLISFGAPELPAESRRFVEAKDAAAACFRAGDWSRADGGGGVMRHSCHLCVYVSQHCECVASGAK